MLTVTTTWRNDNPNTVWNRLKAQLGREPTNQEAAAAVKQILRDAATERLIDQAGKGALPFQRKQ